jgi:hypothetical protein
MNWLKLLSLLAVITISTTLMSSSAYAFDPTSINMTLNNVQTTSYDDFDVLTIFFSLFNNNAESVLLTGHNMLYLNDTNANYWEISTDNHIEGISNTCPILNTTISSGQSENLQLCYVIPKSDEIGYSMVLNNDYYMMDMEIEEFTLESVSVSFKTTANLWCNDSISDSEYFTSVQSYIQQGDISVLRGESSIDIGTPVPDWVKNNACAWSNDAINQYQFLDGVYWLIDNGKVQLQ